MNLSVAMQLMCEAIPGIRSPIRQEQLPMEAETTSWFFDSPREWCSLMSSHHFVFPLSKVHLSMYEEAVGILHLAQDTMRLIKKEMMSH